MIMSLLAQYLIPAVLAIFALNGALMAWWYYNYKKVKARYDAEKMEALKKHIEESMELDKSLSEHDEKSAINLDAVKKSDYSDGVDLK